MTVYELRAFDISALTRIDEASNAGVDFDFADEATLALAIGKEVRFKGDTVTKIDAPVPLRTALLPLGTDSISEAVGQLAGKQWQPRDIGQLWIDAVQRNLDEGYLGPTLARRAQSLDTLTRAVMVCLSESQGFEEAVNTNYGPNGEVLSVDRGGWQENDRAHPEISDAEAYHMPTATYHAVRIWADSRGSFGPWYGFTKNVYLFDSYRRRAVCSVGGNLMAVQLHGELAAIGYTSSYHPVMIDPRNVRLANKKIGYVPNH